MPHHARRFRCSWLTRSLVPFALLLLGVTSLAAPASAAAAQATGPKPTIPEEKDRPRHDQFLTIAKAGGVDLLFIGDSITDGWRSGGLAVWTKYFAPLKAANFGISGDRTEHVIWRLRNGELEGIQPKVAVIMIGTNNGDPAADVALGIKTIISDIHERSPRTKILLLGIFPRGEKPDDGSRVKNAEVNRLIAAYATQTPPGRVEYLDIGARFLGPGGILSKDIMPDLLHPNEKGYQIWADAIIDQVKQLMQDDPANPAPSFMPPSTVAKVAKLEESIATGKVAAGVKALQKLAADKEAKDAKTAEAATDDLARIEAWKSAIDAEIEGLAKDGDVFAAAELLARMATSYDGDIGKTYRARAAELKKDPGYAAGREYQRMAAMPIEARRDPRFAKLVEAFVKKNPGWYADKAPRLVVAP